MLSSSGSGWRARENLSANPRANGNFVLLWFGSGAEGDPILQSQTNGILSTTVIVQISYS